MSTLKREVAVGDHYKQVKAIEFPKFDRVGQEFTIYEVVAGKGVLASGMGMNWGATFDELDEYFEYVPQIVETELPEQVTEVFVYEPEEEEVRVIYNNRATVVILEDGSRGVSKCLPEDEYDADLGFDIAYTRAKIKQLQKDLKTYTK